MTGNTLDTFLMGKGYAKVSLKKNGVGHFEISGELNGVPARFILDTGASQSVLDKGRAANFDLVYEDETHSAGGLGTASFETLVSRNNRLLLGGFGLGGVVVAVLDLSHVNQALHAKDAEPVDGVLGADVLSRTRAVIDYGADAVYFAVE